MVTLTPRLPLTYPKLAVALLASVANVDIGAPAASAAAAVDAPASAAPCIVRWARYQLATSVPRPVKPAITDRVSAKTIAVAPLRSPRTRPFPPGILATDGRRVMLVISKSRIASSRSDRVAGLRSQRYRERQEWNQQWSRVACGYLVAALRGGDGKH